MQLFTKQVLMSAKITFVLMLAASLQITARGLAQKVSLEMDHVPLKTVMDSISRQTGYLFFYQLDQLKQSQPVTIHARDADMKDALARIFAHQPFTYSIANQTIVLAAKAATENANAIPPVLLQSVRGSVTNEKGEPIAGASILVKGTTTGTITDDNGNFNIDNVDESSTLVISAIGYETKEIKLNGQTSLQITLQEKINKLDETQIIAYGTTSQRFSTGNISTVSAKDIEKSPVTNVLLAMQGRVPGIFIEQATGFAGSSVKVRIQGQNSINSGNEPFYVIDGVPYSSQLLPVINGIQNTNHGTNNASSPLNYINPEDIESITVLKDADATSIYGSRAANGAILITTKKGKAGDTRVNVNIQQGIGQVSRKMKLLNTQQYLQMRWQAIANDSINIFAPPYNTSDYRGSFEDLLLWDTTRYTDWQKVLIGNTAHYTDANLSFSGGSGNINYLVGSNYHRETTVQLGDYADQRASVHFNVNSISNNRRLRLELSGSYLKDNNQLPKTDITTAALQLAPDAPPLFNPDGSLNWAHDASGVLTFSNPVKYIYGHYNVKTDNLVSNASISYQLLKGLNIKSTFGYTDIRTNEIDYNTDKVIDPSVIDQGYTRQTTFGNNHIHTWDIEPQLTYDLRMNKHAFNILLGSSFQETESYRQALKASGFNSDAVMENIAAASSISVAGGSGSISTDYKYNAVFGRLGYNYAQKYIVNLNIRRDGSSRFGSGNRFHNFASAAAAWIFSEESAIKDHLSWLSFGKLRASYGTTGNDQIGDYAYLSLYNNLNPAVPYQTGSSGLYPGGLPNPYLQWEETKKLQFGLDLGFIQDRILLNLNYNYNRSSNQLLGYSLPAITGFGSISANFPATVQNTGWEITLSTENIQSRNFQWSTSFNITIPKNKLVAFPNIETSSYATQLIIGKSINTGRYYDFAGVNPQTGVYQFRAADGSLTQDPGYDNTNKTVLLNPDPKYYGGLENSLSYKGFQLDFLFQFVNQLAGNYKFGFYAPGNNYNGTANQPVSVLDSWTGKGDVSDIQAYTNSFYSLPIARARYNGWSYVQNSNQAFSNANYIRLKNLSLSWQLPESWVRKATFQNARVYLQSQNLLTFTNYIGLDPETAAGVHPSMPTLRIITVGLNVTL